MNWKDNFPKENRYFETENGILYKGDCIEIMKQFPEKSVDLILTDPPYGINKEYDIYKDTEENLINLIEQFMPEVLRIGKNALITSGIKNIHLYPKPYWILAWIYNATVDMGKYGFTLWQPILAYGKDPYLVNKKGRKLDIIKSSGVEKKLHKHPVPKPLKFWKKLLIRGSVFKDDLILDPFIGSGTTAIACEQLNRRWIGIEISKEYCEISKKRIIDETMQTKFIF